MSVKSEAAVAMFKEGYNCAQAVFAVFAEDYGIDKETAWKISSSFGGGIGRMREVCGAFSGMCMVAGLETGAVEGRDQASKANNYATVQKLAEEYKKMSGGSIICKELLGLAKPENSPIPEARTDSYYKKRPCVELVEIAVKIMEKYLNAASDS